MNIILTERWPQDVAFADDCIGDAAKKVVDALKPGGVLAVEDLPFSAFTEEHLRLLAVLGAHAGDALALVTAAYHSQRTGAAVAMPIGAAHPLYRSWLPQ